MEENKITASTPQEPEKKEDPKKNVYDFLQHPNAIEIGNTIRGIIESVMANYKEVKTKEFEGIKWDAIVNKILFSVLVVIFTIVVGVLAWKNILDKTVSGTLIGTIIGYTIGNNSKKS